MKIPPFQKRIFDHGYLRQVEPYTLALEDGPYTLVEGPPTLVRIVSNAHI